MSILGDVLYNKFHRVYIIYAIVRFKDAYCWKCGTCTGKKFLNTLNKTVLQSEAMVSGVRVVYALINTDESTLL